MDALLDQVRNYLHGIWRYRYAGLLTAWLVAIIGAAIVLLVPNRYVAKTRIFVDTQSMLKPLLAGLAVQPNVSQQISILSRTLVTRPNVEKIIRLANLEVDLNDREQKNELIDHIIKRVDIRTDEDPSLYIISYEDQMPEVAQRVVQAMVTIFVEASVGDKRKDSDAARRFIEDQIRVYQNRLLAAENRLKEFKIKNIGFSDRLSTDFTSRIGRVHERLEKTRLQLKEAQQAKTVILKRLRSEQSSTTPITNTLNPEFLELKQKIQAQEALYQSLLHRFTTEHPDLLHLRDSIAQLKAQKNSLTAQTMKTQKNQDTLDTPVGQQLKIALADVETNIAALSVRVTAFKAEYQSLKKASETIPVLEAEFTRLIRDYEVHKSNYEKLVARREAASISGEIEANAGIANFRVIDPPRTDPNPISPDRLRLWFLSLIVTLSAGIGSAYICNQVRPVFHDLKGLKEITQQPVLGVITMIETANSPQAKTEGSRIWLWLGVLALLSAYFALLLYILFVH